MLCLHSSLNPAVAFQAELQCPAVKAALLTLVS
jgi:hypothetical protein